MSSRPSPSGPGLRLSPTPWCWPVPAPQESPVVLVDLTPAATKMESLGAESTATAVSLATPLLQQLPLRADG
jgi:hypothetical protein